MTVTATQRLSYNSSTTASSYTTGSSTPTANTLLLLRISCANNGVDNAPLPSTVTGNGLTWVKINEAVSTNGNISSSLWRSMGAAPTAGAISVTFPVTAGNVGIKMIEYGGVNITGTSGSGAIRTSQSAVIAQAGATLITTTLTNTVTAGNATAGFLTVNSGSASTITADANYVKIGTDLNVSNSPAHSMSNEFAATGNRVVSYTTSGTTSKILHSVEIVAGVSNVAPTANAGPDQTGIEPGATVTLDFTGSADTDGTIASYSVSQTAGTTVTLSGSGSGRTFTAPYTPNAQTLTFSLTVTDNGGSTSAADTVNIGVLPWDEYIRVSGAWVPRAAKQIRKNNAWYTSEIPTALYPGTSLNPSTTLFPAL